MTFYDKALICKAGHLINSAAERNPGRNTAFCPKCGESTIGTCDNCGTAIRGNGLEGRSGWVGTGLRNLGFRGIPRHCHACGKAYPWTQRKADALNAMLDELDGLSGEEREKLKKSIPDIIADTPNSNTAALRFKKAMAKVGKEGGKMLLEVLTRVATEAVKKSAGLG